MTRYVSICIRIYAKRILYTCLSTTRNMHGIQGILSFVAQNAER